MKTNFSLSTLFSFNYFYFFFPFTQVAVEMYFYNKKTILKFFLFCLVFNHPPCKRCCIVTKNSKEFKSLSAKPYADVFVFKFTNVFWSKLPFLLLPPNKNLISLV